VVACVMQGLLGAPDGHGWVPGNLPGAGHGGLQCGVRGVTALTKPCCRAWAAGQRRPV
jgi:hypothetical protein